MTPTKALTALYLGLLTWAGVVISSVSGPITAPEWLGLAGVPGAAFGVWAVPNQPLKAARRAARERGASDLAIAAFILVAAILVYLLLRDRP
jgi:hypothetical protein